jgi:hypothetical protein
MPIPDFDHNDVLPPHLGNHAADSACMSPYPCTSIELCNKLGTSDERCKILLGFLELRQSLRTLGIKNGFHWLDGSFTENVERTRNSAPRDIDVVTFLEPANLPTPLSKPMADTLVVLQDRDATRKQFRVDHIVVQLVSTSDRTKDATRLVDVTRYWFGLFSHRRNDDVWKGMLRLSLDTVADDTQALNSLRAKTL